MAAKAIGLQNNTIFSQKFSYSENWESYGWVGENPWIWAWRSGFCRRPVVAVLRSVSLIWNTPLPYSQLSCHSSIYPAHRSFSPKLGRHSHSREAWNPGWHWAGCRLHSIQGVRQVPAALQLKPHPVHRPLPLPILHPPSEIISSINHLHKTLAFWISLKENPHLP